MKLICTLFLTFVILISGCSASTPENMEVETFSNSSTVTISIEEYKQQVAEWNEKVLDAVTPLLNMSKWELNYMKTLGRPSDDIVERAFTWLEKESEYTETAVKEARTEISSLLKQISDNTDTSPEGGMGDIFNQAVSLYENYEGFYETVTTVPSSVNAFAEDISTYLSEIPTGIEALRDLLED